MQTFSEKMPYQTMIRKILCHSLFMVTALQAKPFHDVPMNHWAYEAISQLSAINVIVGRSPSAFDGDESLSRYELAEVTAKLMIELENSNLGSSENILLERLNQEFSEELDLIQNRYQKMERAILGHLDQGHEETNQKLTFSGINRIRNEWWKLNSNDLNQGLSDELTWMRTRIGLSQRLDKAKVYVELQHSTSFGNGANSNGELADDPLAMHQAFGQLKFGRKNTSSIQIGRFAMSYGDETLIGNNDWNNVGHTFDGFRYSFQDQKQSFEMEIGRAHV